MAFNTRLWNERKITCTEQDSNPCPPVTSQAWYPLHHRVNLAGYMATYRCVEIGRSQSTGNFSFETFVCITAKPQIKSGYVTDRNFLLSHESLTKTPLFQCLQGFLGSKKVLFKTTCYTATLFSNFRLFCSFFQKLSPNEKTVTVNMTVTKQGQATVHPETYWHKQSEAKLKTVPIC